MNLIEAFLQAEQGKLISNNFIETNSRVLKYMGNGVFYEYEIVNDKPIYKYEVRTFTVASIISTGWYVVEKNYFIQEPKQQNKLA